MYKIRKSLLQRKKYKYGSVTNKWSGHRIREEFDVKNDEWLLQFSEEEHVPESAIAFIPVYKEYGVGFSDKFFADFWMSKELYDYMEKQL